MIPWTRYSGQEVERVLSVLICRQHPSAIHIRPSQGDGGIDILERKTDDQLVVYQIKSYATNLTARQKRDIKLSLEKACATSRELGQRMVEWHLVLPLDPTPQIIQWFYSLPHDSCTKLFWDGLSTIDGWIALMPDVSDYYLKEKHDRILSLAKDALSAAMLPNFNTVNELSDRLASLVHILQADDPNYRYAIHVYTNVDGASNASAVSENSLMSVFYRQDDVLVQIDVSPRYSEACKLAPIMGIVQLLSTKSGDVTGDLGYLRDYGVRIKDAEAKIVQHTGPMLLNGVAFMQRLDITAEPDIRDLLCMPFGIESSGATLTLACDEAYRGLHGIFFRASDKSGMLSVEATISDGGEIHPVLHLDISRSVHNNVTLTIRCLELYKSVASTGRAVLTYGNKTLCEIVFEVGASESKTLTEDIEGLQKLERIEERIGQPIPVPDIERVTEEEDQTLTYISELINGSVIADRWRRIAFEFAGDIPSLTNEPYVLLWQDIDSFTIEGVRYRIDQVESMTRAIVCQIDLAKNTIEFVPVNSAEPLCRRLLMPDVSPISRPSTLLLFTYSEAAKEHGVPLQVGITGSCMY